MFAVNQVQLLEPKFQRIAVRAKRLNDKDFP